MKRKCLSFALVLVLMLALVPVTTGASNITVREIVSGLEYDSIGEFSEGLAV